MKLFIYDDPIPDNTISISEAVVGFVGGGSSFVTELPNYITNPLLRLDFRQFVDTYLSDRYFWYHIRAHCDYKYREELGLLIAMYLASHYKDVYLYTASKPDIMAMKYPNLRLDKGDGTTYVATRGDNRITLVYAYDTRMSHLNNNEGNQYHVMAATEFGWSGFFSRLGSNLKRHVVVEMDTVGAGVIGQVTMSITHKTAQFPYQVLYPKMMTVDELRRDKSIYIDGKALTVLYLEANADHDYQPINIPYTGVLHNKTSYTVSELLSDKKSVRQNELSPDTYCMIYRTNYEAYKLSRQAVDYHIVVVPPRKSWSELTFFTEAITGVPHVGTGDQYRPHVLQTLLRYSAGDVPITNIILVGDPEDTIAYYLYNASGMMDYLTKYLQVPVLDNDVASLKFVSLKGEEHMEHSKRRLKLLTALTRQASEQPNWPADLEDGEYPPWFYAYAMNPTDKVAKQLLRNDKWLSTNDRDIEKTLTKDIHIPFIEKLIRSAEG